MPTSNRAPSALRAYRLRELAIAAAIGIAAWNASGCGAGPDIVQPELRATGGSEPRERTVFVGTYTGEDSRGIHAFRFDEQTGSFTSLGLAAETASPSFLVASADGRFVYAVNETSTWRGQRTGSVSAFAVDRANGRLTLLNEVASGGEHPCHLALDRSGRFLAVANYTSGTFAVLPVSSDGQLGAATVYTNRGSGPDAERQQGPHAHQVVFDPTNRLLFAVDLGADRTFIYQFDPATGRLVAQDPPAAAAPRSQ